MKKFVAFMLVLALAMLPGVVRAEEIRPGTAIIKPFYVVVGTISAGLSISGGTASCSGAVRPTDGATKSSVAVKLQKKEGGSWKTIETWTGSGSGTSGASASGTKKVSSGNSYKVVVTGTVKDLNGKTIETITKESAVKSY